MNYFIKFDGHWLNNRNIDNGWYGSFSEDPRVARLFKSKDDAQSMLDRLARYGVKAELIECPYSCPA